VRAVPEFRGDEKLLASDDGWYDFFQCASDFVLVPVDPGEVKVAVPIADGNLDLYSPGGQGKTGHYDKL
jgi:hypothetical protein